MIFIPEIIFLVANTEHFNDKQWQPLISSVVFFICIVLMLKIFVSNPGFIISKENHWLEMITEQDNTRMCVFSGKYIQSYRNGRLQRLKFCKSCFILRPFRTSHCSICGACVENFDHHCPWLGICIGKNNYREFFFFISGIFLLSSFDFAICASILKDEVDHNTSINNAFEKNWGTVFVMFYTGTVNNI